MQQIVTGYFDSRKFDDTVDSLNTEIASYVESDPSKFITYDEYKTAVAELKKLITLRAESISGQLDETIPSTTSGQEADSSALIDASSINMNALGSMMGGGMGGEGFGRGGNEGQEFGQEMQMPDSEQNQTSQTSATSLIWGVNPFILFMLILVFYGTFVFIMEWKREF